jgi:hypothetical protein
MTDEIEGTFDKLKAGAKAVAKKVIGIENPTFSSSSKSILKL